MLEMSKFCTIKPKALWSQLLTTSLRQILFFYTCQKLFVLQKVTANLMIHKAVNIPIQAFLCPTFKMARTELYIKQNINKTVNK